MLTGRQIRQARKLLGWSRVRFSQTTLLTQAMVAAVESTDGAAWLNEEQEIAIRSTLETAGVEFILENGSGAGVRRRRPPAISPTTEHHE